MKKEVIDYTIKGKDGEDDFHGSITYNVPEDFEEAKVMWGEETTLAKAIAQVKIDVRRHCYMAKDVEDAQDRANNFLPGVRTSAGSRSGMSKEVFKKELDKMDLDELSAYLEEKRQSRERGEQ